MTESSDAVVIGAGPAGLAACACLTERGVPYLVLERADRVGSAWHRHYERLHLHTTRDESHLPGRPFPSDWPTYVSRAGVAAYLDDYAEAYGIEALLGREVANVRREGGAWAVTTTAGDAFQARHVVVATGFNRRPRVPTWPGMERYEGVIRHSAEYRSGEGLAGEDVLVVGMGNTGAEIAIDLHEHGARPTISIRSPVNIVPRDILGRPTAKTALLLGRLPPRVADPIGTFLRRVFVGDLTRYGIETPEVPPLAQLREQGKTPVVDVGTVALIKKGLIRVAGGIDRFEPEGVVLSDGASWSGRHVILATGYDSAVEELIPDAEGLLDPRGHPVAGSATGRHAGLHFVGFNGYSTGGVLRSIRHEAPGVAERIRRSPAA